MKNEKFAEFHFLCIATILTISIFMKFTIDGVILGGENQEGDSAFFNSLVSYSSTEDSNISQDEEFLEANDCLAIDKAELTTESTKPDRVVLVVAPPVFHTNLQRWIDYRQSQGYQILLLSLAPKDNETSDNQGFLSSPVASPNEIREKIRKVAQEHEIEAILLVGDGAPTEKAVFGWRDVVPAPRVPALVVQVFGSEELLASDSYYADIDNDEIPDVPIARLPVETPRELEVCVDNIINYEQKSPAGNWTRKINIIAGPNGLDLRAIGSAPGEAFEGNNPFNGISMLVTSVVDKIARKLFAEYLPQEFVVSLTQFSLQSVFCPYPADFEAKTLDRINEGALFWVYLGHGRVVGLDRYYAPSGRDYGVLEIEDCGMLNCQGHAPIMLLFACYTGAYDASIRCLAEEALLQKGGPVAVLGASRRTAPYGMCYFGSALLEAAFSSPDATDNAISDGYRLLGELYHEAQRRTLEEIDEEGKIEDENLFSFDEENNKSDVDATKSEDNPTESPKPGSQLEWINQRLQKSLDDANKNKRKNHSFKKSIDQIASFFDPTASRLKDQLKDHIAEFNLFGDPLLRVKFPTRVPIEAPDIVYSDEEIQVSGKLPMEEGTEAIIQAELLPADFRPNFTLSNRSKNFIESENARQEYNETYHKANAFIIDAVRTRSINGKFKNTLKIPRDCSGEYVVRIAASWKDRYAIGSKRILIRPKSVTQIAN